MSFVRRTTTLLPACAALLAVAACGPSETVKFGAVLPLTGDASVYGNSVRKGVELGYDQIRQDTAMTYSIEVEILDSGSDPAKAAELAAQLFESSSGIVGGVTSEEALAMIPATVETEKLLMVPTASTEKLNRAARSGFRLFTTTVQESSVMATFVDDTLKARRVAIVSRAGEPGDGFTEGFTASFENLGGEIVAVVQVDGSSSVEAVVEEVLASEPDTVYLALAGEWGPDMIRELRTQGVGSEEDGNRRWIVSTSQLASSALLEQAGDAANEVYITQSVFELQGEDGAPTAFAAAYREKYGEDPDLYAAHGYDSIVMLAATTEKIANKLPGEFLKGLRSLDPVVGASGPALKFNESGNAQKFPRIHWIDGGRPRDFQKAQAERRQEFEEERRKLQERTRRLRQQSRDP